MTLPHTFISHASADKATADAVCAGLEARGVKCWIAPRDIPAGEDFAHAILDGINGSGAMVIVYSAQAAESKHVAREVERAVAKDVRVIPLRIEKVPPRGALEYLLSTTQWLHADRAPTATQLDVLAEALRRPRAPAVLRAASRKPALAIAAVTAVLALAGLGAWRHAHHHAIAPGDKSVAVLPFTNLSSEADSQYFADGLQDSVITHLATVRDLKIISRSSVVRYREGNRDMRQIAADLGVANLVEASVQRIGNKLHLNAQLIRAEDDSHVWAAEFDRDLADTFKVQSELAEQIALAVNANLTEDERRRLARPPTKSTAALALYEQAHDIWQRFASFATARDHEARDLLTRAIALDPEFAAAYALRGMFEADGFWSDRDAGLLKSAGQDAAEALRLAPELAEAHLARALYLATNGDKPGSIEPFTRALALAPNNADVLTFRGAILRQLARYDEAFADVAKAAELDPQNELALLAFANNLEARGRFSEADATWARVVKVATDPAQARASRLTARFRFTGELAAAEAAWRARPDDSAGDCTRNSAVAKFTAYRRQFREAAALIEPCAVSWLGLESRSVTIGRYLRLAGRTAEAAPWFKKTIHDSDAQLAQRPDLVPEWLDKAESLASLGQRAPAKAALLEAQAAWAKPGLDGDASTWNEHSARVYVLLGEPDQALALLSAAFTGPVTFSVHEVRANPEYDPIRHDPRFQKLIAEHLPKPPASPLPPL